MTLDELNFNRPVTLADDPAFLGYVVAVGPADQAGNTRILIAISEPGTTDKRGQQLFPLAALAPVPGPAPAKARR